MSVSGVYAGRTDVPLDATGRAAASSWARALADVPGLHSPLLRASETAKLAELDSVELPALREWDLGELEGVHAETYRQAHPAWNLFSDGAPGGESPIQIADRALRVIERARDSDRSVVTLVGHGQFSKAIAATLLDLPLAAATRFTWGPARAAVFTWRSSAQGYALAGWNRTPSTLKDLVEGNS